MQQNHKYSAADDLPSGFLQQLKARRAGKGGSDQVHVIVNPAAGKDQPILKTLNATFKGAGIDWDVFITKEAGDGRRFAQEAAQAGALAVLAHGGDGTVMEAASGLIGTDIPLGILPGGTANVLALDLGIPGDIEAACALLVNPQATLRKVDIGQVGEFYFLIRAGMGFEAAMVEGADRELKDRLGVFAYAFSALQALADPPIARYHLKLDGQEVDVMGLTCIIANSGSLGLPGITFSSKVSVSDGLLDVIVVTRADLASLVALAASVLGGGEEPPALQHWQVREADVFADPAQQVQVDGEMLAHTPISARVIPQAVNLIVPPPESA